MNQTLFGTHDHKFFDIKSISKWDGNPDNISVDPLWHHPTVEKDDNSLL